MRQRTITGLSAAALSLAATGLMTAPPATAGGDDHDGDHDPAVVLRLTDRTVDRLTAGPNGIAALGAADKDTHEGSVYLSLPLKGGDAHDGDHDRGGDRGGDGDHDDVFALAGAIAYTGAGPDVRWARLKVDLDHGTITARLGGDRATILTVDHGDKDHARGGDHGTALKLTAAGARSLNAAAPGAPFSAGDTFSGDSDGCS